MDKNIGANVAVILPCHSWPQYLPEALNSIQSQSVMPATTICVLDKPPDSEEYERILLRHPGLIKIWLPSNQGPSSARNAGAGAVSEMGLDWMVFLDEDDLLHPHFIEKMLLSSQVCPRSIHYCDWVKHGKWVGYTRTPEYTYDRLLAGPFMMSTSLIRTKVWEDVKKCNGHGFDPSLSGWEDWLFFLEAGALGHYGARVGLGLVRYRKHAASISDLAHKNLEQIVQYIRVKMRQMHATDLIYQIPGN